MDLIKKINSFLRKQDRISCIILFIAILIGVFVEALGVGIIIPFIHIVLNPTVMQDLSFEMFRTVLSIHNHFEFIIWASIILVGIFVVKNAYLYLLFYFQNKFLFSRQNFWSITLLSAYLTKPYEYFFRRNTAELQRNINVCIPEVVVGILLNSFIVASEVLLAIAILLLLVINNPISAIVVIASLGGTSCLFYYFMRGKVTYWGEESAFRFTSMIKLVNQSVGGIKEIKVLGRESFCINEFSIHSNKHASVREKFQVASQVPRLYIETMAVVGMSTIIVVNVLLGETPESLMATIGLFAMAAFRIMPSINRVTTYMTAIRFSIPSLNLVYEDLQEAVYNAENEKLLHKNISKFDSVLQEIKFVDVTYNYSGVSVNTLNKINLTIKRGDRIGIIGSSGAGKTTLVDVILGLLKPKQGRLLINGEDISCNIDEWRNRIGYIPQNIYLNDDSIARNVAFGLSNKDIDVDQVWRALEVAQLKDFVQKLPDGLNTQIGERGICLSGGQRQRIGIARALYHNPEILILDEATSALDQETEAYFMQAIEQLGEEKTLIIIAHRLTTIKKCTSVYEIDKGVLNCRDHFDIDYFGNRSELMREKLI